MRTISAATLIFVLASPVLLTADVTIRYKTETVGPMNPRANAANSQVVHMKGNKGVTISDAETTIVDFAKQEVTIVDTARKKFATVPASEYSARMSAQMKSAMPQVEGVKEMLKSVKTACDSKNSGQMETIQGVRAEQREVTCSMTMPMPDNVKQVMPAMGMKFVVRLWFALPAEKVRVPELWQLSGFELWQQYFMNPMESLGDMAPEGMAPLFKAMQRDQSPVLRSSMEMFMSMPGTTSSEADAPLMKIDQEVVEISNAPLSDALFTVPADYAAEPFTDLMNATTKAALDAAKTRPVSSLQAVAAPIPDHIKAYVPFLFPVNETHPAAPVDANGNKLQGSVELLVTVGPKGNVEQADVLAGPEALRSTAAEAVRHWMFRPVIRNGEPVAAYTNATVDFTDYSKRPTAANFQYTPEMARAEERRSQLAEAFPRSPEQEFADLEQDAGTGDPERRYNLLGNLALKAAKLGNFEKAKAYATDLLAAAQNHAGGWNYGNAIHDGHIVLGLVALRDGDIATANRQLLEAGATTGSPQLNSFGPDMTLASELLKKGQRDAVLDYFDLCRKFWTLGAARLDFWAETVRSGGTPAFEESMR